jgi:hypothetical protein
VVRTPRGQLGIVRDSADAILFSASSDAIKDMTCRRYLDSLAAMVQSQLLRKVPLGTLGSLGTVRISSRVCISLHRH